MHQINTIWLVCVIHAVKLHHDLQGIQRQLLKLTANEDMVDCSRVEAFLIK